MRARSPKMPEYALATGGEAERAMALYEAFLAGCCEKIEECDDSSGSLGMFWDTLFRGWVVARQAAGCPAAETIRLVLKWKAADQYGFCHDIEKEVAPVLNDEAYSLLVANLRKCVGDVLAAIQPPRPAAIFEYDSAVRLPAQSLKEVFRVRGDAASYAAMCERLGMSPMDCQRLAEIDSLVTPSPTQSSSEATCPPPPGSCPSPSLDSAGG